MTVLYFRPFFCFFRDPSSARKTNVFGTGRAVASCSGHNCSSNASLRYRQRRIGTRPMPFPMLAIFSHASHALHCFRNTKHALIFFSHFSFCFFGFLVNPRYKKHKRKCARRTGPRRPWMRSPQWRGIRRSRSSRSLPPPGRKIHLSIASPPSRTSA